MDYLHITEYSKYAPKHKIPERKKNEYDLIINDSIIRTSIDNCSYKIKESFDNIYQDSIVSEQSIPLKNIFIYDKLDVIDADSSNQKLAYVFECPICLDIVITTDKNYSFCEKCENTKFPPKVIALINLEQMEDYAVEHKDCNYVQVKDDKVVYECRKEEEKY